MNCSSHTLTGYSDVTIGFSLVDDFHHLIRTCDEPLRRALYVSCTVLVLVNGEVGLRDVQKVSDLV